MAEMVKRVRVSGRVQGVGFRAWARDRAERLGLDGWVRNEPDGSVLAIVSGPPDQVERMLRDLWDGPPGSRVTAIDARDAEAPEAAGFAILW